MIRRDRGWVILRHEGSNLWRQVTAMVAPTRRMAINKAIQGASNPYPTGSFQAIPDKEWGHVIVKEVMVAPTLERLARDLVDAVRANEADLVGNDLGNALDAIEDALG